MFRRHLVLDQQVQELDDAIIGGSAEVSQRQHNERRIDRREQARLEVKKCRLSPALMPETLATDGLRI